LAQTDGLNRLNGYSFVVSKHKPADSNSISDNFISTILEIIREICGLETQGGGLNQYDRLHNKFTAFYHDPNNKNSLPSKFHFFTIIPCGLIPTRFYG